MQTLASVLKGTQSADTTRISYGFQVDFWSVVLSSAIILSGASSSKAAENEEIKYSLTICENPSIHVDGYKVVEGFKDIGWLENFHGSKMPERLDSVSEWQSCFSEDYVRKGTLEKWTESFLRAKTGEAEPSARSTFTSLGAMLFFEDEGKKFAMAYVTYGIRFQKVLGGFEPERKAGPDEWDLEIGNVFLQKQEDGEWKITWQTESPIFERLLRLEGDVAEIEKLAGENITVLSGKKD